MIRLIFLILLGGMGFAASQAQTVAPQAGTVIINTAPQPQPERDKCEPLNSRLDDTRCESALSTTRTMYIPVGTQRILRFDRPFTAAELDSYPVGAVDVTPGGTNTLAVLEARAPGQADVYFFGEGTIQRGATKIRDVLFAVTVIATTDPPGPPSAVRIFDGMNLKAGAITYECHENGCQRSRRR